MDFRWKTHLLPCSFCLPCAYECVMTDVVPCCFPAEDGLKVHQEGYLDIQPPIQDASKTPRTAGQIINKKRIVVVLNSHWRTFKNGQRVYDLCSFSRLSTTCRENNKGCILLLQLGSALPCHMDIQSQKSSKPENVEQMSLIYEFKWPQGHGEKERDKARVRDTELCVFNVNL